MAVSFAAMLPQKIQSWAVQILPADASNKKTLVTAGTNGSIIESISVSNTDSASAYAISWYVNDGTTDHLLATQNVPLNSGATTAAAAVDALRSGPLPGLPVDANGNFVLYLPSGWILKASSGTTVAAAKVIDIVAMGADY